MVDVMAKRERQVVEPLIVTLIPGGEIPAHSERIVIWERLPDQKVAVHTHATEELEYRMLRTQLVKFPVVEGWKDLMPNFIVPRFPYFIIVSRQQLLL
jgi:hypothetical protein